MRALLTQAIQDQFSLTTELPRTLRALFTRPGFLTLEYSAGRIARYIPPLRLYLVTSVLFFLIFSLRAGPRADNSAVPADSAPSAPSAPPPTAPTGPVVSPVDSVRDMAGVSEAQRCMRRSGGIRFCTPSRWLNEKLRPRTDELNKLPKGETVRRLREFLVQRAATVVFLLLPMFALLLQVLYWRTRRFYAEHFVFALHMHSFALSVFALILVLRSVVTLGYPAHALLLWVIGYLLFALKRVYGQGWVLTTFKLIVLCGAYSVLLVIGLMVEVVVAFLVI